LHDIYVTPKAISMKKYWLIILLFFPVFLQAQVITTVAGGGVGGGADGLGDGGLAINAKIGFTGGLAVDKCGNIYIADAHNERIRRVDAVTGIITTVAGTGVAGYNGDSI